MSRTINCGCVVLLLIGVCVPWAHAAADQVEMNNGDRYIGKVLSLDSTTLVLQSEHLGKLNLPRTNVAVVRFENKSLITSGINAAQTNKLSADNSGVLGSLGANSNLIQRVQKQFLAGSGPGAQQKFEELVSGLLTGKLSVEDIRSQAKATAEQVRIMRKDMDESSGWALDGYLAILDQFLGQASTATKFTTNGVPTTPKLPDVPEEQ